MSSYGILGHIIVVQYTTNILQWTVPVIHLLNTSTRMPFEILFVMLIRAIIFPFILGIQCLHENEKITVFW